MVRITEDLIRRRAEHNEGEIFSLEELALHQQDIERIEHLDRWCKDLKILYLQNNLIENIENVGRLKKLEYLNLALNNIGRIDNLQGCESLRKLDLTVNFIGELTSIETLQENYNLREMYLTGNPCTDYKGYREFVIITLPQLQWLDGMEIVKSERIKSSQVSAHLRSSILQQQRENEKNQKSSVGNKDENCNDIDNESKLNFEKDFWTTPSPYTPETRASIHNHFRKGKELQSKKNNAFGVVRKEEQKLTKKNGEILNKNQPRFDFDLIEDDEMLELTLKVFRYMDTSLLEVDIQPKYIRVTVKGKVFQLRLPEEVRPDASTAQRSQTTGYLVIKMPKMEKMLQLQKLEKKCPRKTEENVREKEKNRDSNRTNVLEACNEKSIMYQLSQISTASGKIHLGRNSDFVDDPDVPPLI